MHASSIAQGFGRPAECNVYSLAISLSLTAGRGGGHQDTSRYSTRHFYHLETVRIGQRNQPGDRMRLRLGEASAPTMSERRASVQAFAGVCPPSRRPSSS